MSDTTPYANSLFQQPWWLDAVAPGRWNEVRVENDGEVLARLPYTVEKKMGLTVLMMPPFTQTLGPWFADQPGKYVTRLSNQKKYYNELFDRLPPFDYFKCNFHHTVDNWLPLYWRGFEQTTRYTYLLEDISDPDRLWEEFSGSTRREIRKAREQLTVTEEDDPGLMWKMHTMTLRRQDEKPDAAGTFRRIHESCRERDSGQIFIARDAEGTPHGALFLVWDNDTAYYLMGGADPELRNSGVSSLLMWHAIQFASGVSRRFDFEGSMLEPVERFIRGFGGRQKRYFQVTRTSARMRLLLGARDLFTRSSS